MGNYQFKVGFPEGSVCEDPVHHRASNFEMYTRGLWILLNADSETVVLGGVGLGLSFCVSIKLSNGPDVASP